LTEIKKMGKMTIYRGGKNTVCDVKDGTSVLQALKDADVGIYAPCGGAGTCGKCKITARGALSEPESSELSRLTKDEIERGVRLACRAKINGDFSVVVEDAKMSIETDGLSVRFEPDKNDSGEGLGAAVDVGTTTVAVYVCDLKSGEVLMTSSFKNPQSPYGADVISRMDKIISSGDVLIKQKDLIINAINSAIAEICAKLYKSIKDIKSCVICGNTVMEHIACGIDPSPIARAPFTAPTLFNHAYYDAKTLGLDISEEAKCLFAPCVASYVGGDIICGAVASGFDKSDGAVVFIDVGTNGEIGLISDGKMYFCSAAAGPAFEGANIDCGMAGVDGAISSVKLCENGDIALKMVGDAAPRGICGSGLIDAVAIMLDAGVIDETGAFEDGTKFDLAENVYVSEKDVRQVQLAKAAICAGILTLMNEAKIGCGDVSRVVLAGGFGSHINADSARRIGMIPKEMTAETVFAGNTAGMGAVALLLSDEARKRAGMIAVNSVYVELSASAFFMESYIDQMGF